MGPKVSFQVATDQVCDQLALRGNQGRRAACSTFGNVLPHGAAAATDHTDFASYAAVQALGAPDTFAYGDIGTAWAPGPVNGTLEYITLGYPTPAYANGATIRETFGNGMVYQVDVVDTNDVLHTVWTGTDPSQPGTPVDYPVTWSATTYLVKGIKVYTDTDHDLSAWEEIDAIALHGTGLPSADCNANGTPDECELGGNDCNATAVPDDCESIAGGDFDADGAVGLGDYRGMVGCLAGPEATPNPPVPACVSACLAAFDFDADGDVDLADFTAFQILFAP